MQKKLLALALALAVLPAMAVPARSKSLAQFDVGYAQCEKRHADMRGRGDDVYARIYRLKLDDDLRTQLAETRKSALYRSERRRASQTLTKNAAASDVSQRLELQCQALQREVPGAAAASAPKR
jgi:hypothetical protein